MTPEQRLEAAAKAINVANFADDPRHLDESRMVAVDVFAAAGVEGETMNNQLLEKSTLYAQRKKDFVSNAKDGNMEPETEDYVILVHTLATDYSDNGEPVGWYYYAAAYLRDKYQWPEATCAHHHRVFRRAQKCGEKLIGKLRSQYDR